MRNMPGFACRLRIGSLGAAALIVLLCSGTSEMLAREPDRPAYLALENQTQGRINAHRREKGLTALEYDARIAAVARRHSEAMAAGRVPLGHQGFEAREKRIEEGIPLEAMAENVGVNSDPVDRTVSAAVSGWLASPGHRRNIEGDYDVTGIGIARGPRGAWFYTQIFGKRARRRAPQRGR